MQVKHNQFIADLPDILKENPKRFWSYFRSKKKCLPSKICHKGVNATDPNGMACKLNKYFEYASNNNTGVSSAVPDIDEYKNMFLSNIFFTESDVFKVLSSLDGSKACGPDGVSPAVIKQCAKELTPSLVTLFNLNMEQSKVPTLEIGQRYTCSEKKVTGINVHIWLTYLFGRNC